MAAILDAIFNFTPPVHDLGCPPKFFYSPRGPLLGSKVKMRGHMIAHRTSISPRTICIIIGAREIPNLFENVCF